MPAKKNISRKAQYQYFNRELSWLAFNRRVLDLSISGSQPLLERLKFLSIVSSNLDEFFEIRVAGLIQQVESGVVDVGLDGLGPRDQLEKIRECAGDLVDKQYACWLNQIVPEMKKQGIVFKTKSEITRIERRWLEAHFAEQIYPVLTPMAIDPAHPFPQLANRSMNILVSLEDPSTKDGDEMMAIIPVPRILPRVVLIDIQPKTEKQTYIFLSDIINIFVDSLFPGYKVKGAWAFRITRNSDLYIDEEEVENLLHKIEEELHKLRRGASVRLEIEHDVDEEILKRLLDSISLPEAYVYRINGPINLLRLMSVYDIIERPDLKDKPFISHVPLPLLNPKELFSALRKEDVLLHHPYESYSSVVDFLKLAAKDPKVFAIKQTLYRTSGDSPVIEALKQAVINGKQVTALVELKARFDEANNIQWARELEEVGVHVVYGLVGLKTHCKASLVVRREAKGLRRYVHLGTGNYNPKTARMYTDLSYFTTRTEITNEVADLFNTLTGFSRKPDFRQLLVAPFNLHERMQELIRREARNARAGKPARIIAKTNSLIEKTTIDNLYAASQAGVKIDLIVRGICGLVPGVPKLSEGIQVRSILGRYLEHCRIYYFENAGNPEVYLGSADWMARNFFRRIECVFPILDKKLRDRIIEHILDASMKDNTASILMSDGSYRPMRKDEEAPISSQKYFMKRAEDARHQDERNVVDR